MKLIPKSSVTDAIVRRDTTQTHTGKGPCAGGVRSWRDTVERLGTLRKAAPTNSWKRQGSILSQNAPWELGSADTGIQSPASGSVRRLHISDD